MTSTHKNQDRLLFGSLFGLSYLFSYTVIEGIPFPIELSVLPTLMVAVGLVAFAFVLVIVSSVLLPAMVQADPSNIEYLTLFAEVVKENGKPYVHARQFGIRAFHYFFACLLPTSILVILSWHLVVNNLPPAVGFVGVFISVVIIATYSGLVITFIQNQIVQNDKALSSKWLKLFFLILGADFLSIFSFTVFVLILIKVFPEIFREGNTFASEYPFALFTLIWFAFSALNFGSFVPAGRIGEIKKDTKSNLYFVRLSAPIPLVPLFIVGLVSIGSVFYGPMSHKLGEAALRTMGIGGGIEMSLCFEGDTLPDGLRELESPTTFGCTRNLKVLFNAGDVVIAKIADDAVRIYSIKRDKVILQSRSASVKK